MVKLKLDQWLRPEDVEPEKEIVFIDSGKHAEIPQAEGLPPVESFEIKVSVAPGEERIWTMNRTSQRAVAQTYSADTEKWIGKKVIVFVTDQNVRGTMKRVIYARVPVKYVAGELGKTPGGFMPWQ